ncbi:heat shock factor protein 5 [Cyprinodon tularosa]|uniref:heat shock factor protein 5 n=1 Tax=Cyprinodon tularosa TaxID=77115 RepID=UPI0018E22137|nr:heat shock factor protein 5 [Cyprinodon tularosa]
MAEANEPPPINASIFPAKLWRMVNNPEDGAIRWDSGGKVIIIDQQLLETRILSPSSITADSFKTTNFTSFVRQLNLYGFKKHQPRVDQGKADEARSYHYYSNPNFVRSSPQLLRNLVRLTVENKAKLSAGQRLTSRLPNSQSGFSGENTDLVLTESCSLPLHPSHQAHPYHPFKFQGMRPQSGTPVPPRYLHRVPVAAPSHPYLHLLKERQVPLCNNYTAVASNSNMLYVRRALLPPTLNRSPGFNSLDHPNHPLQPGCYAPACCLFHPNRVALTTAVPAAQSPSPIGYYQAGSPVTVFGFNRNLHGTENQEGEKNDIDLDAVFQIADEVMQTSSSVCLVKVQTREEPVSVPEPSFEHADAISCDNNRSAAAVTNKKEKLVVSQPDQKAEDAKHEARSDPELSVDANNSAEDSSQG